MEFNDQEGEIDKNNWKIIPINLENVNVEHSQVSFDYTAQFTTDKVFTSRKSLHEWIRDVGKKIGFVIVIKSSEVGGNGRKPRLRFGCERGGTYRKSKNPIAAKGKRQRNVGTRKCECPFDLNCVKLPVDDHWMLNVVCGLHNHPPAQHLEGHPYLARLTDEEQQILIDMSKNLVKPRNILMTLKRNDSNNVSTMKTIYNERAKHRLVEKAGRSQMQQLMSKLAKYNYIEWHRSYEINDCIRDLFLAHPTSVELLHAFPHVLIMDCTYKTNRYRLPLFEIVGVTSTEMTFPVAFVFLEAEREENYTWAMKKLKTLLKDGVLPNVIVTDRELALMKAIECVFPTTKHLLCRWHISKNVAANTKKVFENKKAWDTFCKSWSLLVASNTYEIYEKHVKTLSLEFEQYTEALNYVRETWLIKYREKFVAAWTSKVLHFGNVTTNRAESSHSRLKKHLGSSQGDFETSWKVMHSLIELQHTEIKASFEKSITLVQHCFKPSLFRELRGFVSKDALHLIFDKSKEVENIGLDRSACQCIIRSTHGLPCACEIFEYIVTGQPIPLSAVHPHWRKLDLLPICEDVFSQLSLAVEWEHIEKMFKASDNAGKILIKKKLREIYEPSTTSLLPPIEKVKTKGRPSSKVDTSTKRDPSYFEYVESNNDSHSPSIVNFIQPPKKAPRKAPMTSKKENFKVQRTRMSKLDQYHACFHNTIREHIFNIVDVADDGHCGFRAVASSLGLGEDAWHKIRHDLISELNSYQEDYTRLYGSTERVNELLHTLNYFNSGAPFDRWMTIPDMGHLIASRYNIVFVHLSSIQCLTFLPLRSAPPPAISHKIIALGFVNGNHFVQVNLKPYAPIPPIACNWYIHRYEIASLWEDPYKTRIHTFKKMIGTDLATQEIISLDSP